MPAEIIETNPTPFNKVSVDPITLDIIESALRNARFEMDAVLFRTAMSPGIREQHDEFPMIANPDGKMVVGQFGSFVHGFKREYDGTIEEGTTFLTSDPYSCGGAISHANDWLVLKPVYLEGRLIGYIAMFGHMTDLGGKVPGSLPTDANQIYEEGVVIPIIKIYKDNQLQEDVLKGYPAPVPPAPVEPERLQRPDCRRQSGRKACPGPLRALRGGHIRLGL